MKRKLFALLLAGVLLALTGCQLARPEKTDSELFGDRFAGVYAVYSADGQRNFYDNPDLTEMGTEDIDLGKYGTHAVPKQVLIGEYDEDEREYIFPGLAGYALFVTRAIEEDGWPSTACNSDMADGKFHTTVTDQGNTEEIEGTLYIGPPLGAGPDWQGDENQGPNTFWTLYRVFQTEDGTVYLDGSGNSYGGSIGGSSSNQTVTQKTTIGEEVTEETVSVTVHMEYAPRLTRLTVTQFDENDQPIKAQDLPLQEDLPEIHCLDAAAWVLVEAESSEGVERTLYNVPGTEEQPIYHPVVLLTDSGMGYGASLMISR